MLVDIHDISDDDDCYDWSYTMMIKNELSSTVTAILSFGILIGPKCDLS